MTRDHIKSVMEKRNLTKKEFARQLCVSPRTVEGWMSNRRPSRPMQKLIQSLLKKG